MHDVIYSFWTVVGVLACVLVPVAAVIAYLNFSNRRRINRYWRTLPTLTQYTTRHPECVADLGTKCVRCRSPDIHDRGMTAAADKRRRFVCGRCGKSLYRNER
jgi:hypothetical protein